MTESRSPASPGKGRGLLSALVRAMRPKQWTKNLFVFAPLLFSHEWDKPRLVLRVIAMFAIFCITASGVYLLNDVRDREADRLHPVKRRRPIAAGEVSPGLAVVVGLLLIVAGLAWARFGLENYKPLLVISAYVVVQIAYTAGLKKIVIVDVMCIASGFVLRMLAGGSSAWIDSSAWILVCTIFVSLLLALCKRRHEVTTLGADAAGHRAILADYPPAFLDQLISVATAATLVTYALYTIDPRTAKAHGFISPEGEARPYLAATIPFVIFGVFRYLYLVYRREQGGDPTSSLLRDAPMIVDGVLYAAAVVAVFTLAGR